MSSSLQRGMTLIELIVFIVIVSVGLVGLLSVLNISVFSSADPMTRKQMLSIAEALLEEVELQPFTYCDPTDDNAANATSATLDNTQTDTTKCWRAVEALGASSEQWNGTALSDQTRASTTAPLNNVSDYSGLTLNSPITDINGTALGPAGYSASITVDNGASVALGPAASQITADGTAANMRVVRIAVTVCRGSTWPCAAGTDSLTLEGYRTRYWPNEASW